MSADQLPGPTVRRAVFLDVDGTYADHGVVPAEHVAAVRAARAAGHLVLLCTGRPLSMLPERIRAAGFDGIVGSAGGYVEVGGRVLVDRRFPAYLAARMVEVLDELDAAYLLEAPDALHGRTGVDVRLHALLAEHERARHERDRDAPSDMLERLRMSDDLSAASFGKVTCFDSPVPVGEIAERVGPEVAALPSSVPGMGDRSGELFLADVHKARGMAVVVEHLGMDRADVVAFGDGLNDLEMLQYAGIGVAIAGSDPRVLAAADRVAAGPQDAGLAAAFVELDLV